MMDLSALRERSDLVPMTVTELNEYIKELLERNTLLSRVTVCGEVSNFVSHTSGHLYFSLKDEGGQIRAIMFRSDAARLRFQMKDGMRVILTGSVSVYAKSGAYQLYVRSAQPDGVGALYLAYEQLKAKLAGEGLFDEAHKLPLPRHPLRVGVITSPTGAAVRDIINVSTRRFPGACIYLYPALVQGEGAEDSLISALDYFEKSRLVDAIIIGRGGGSIEDLWAFNGERLARKLYEMTIPTVSAVGHETDFTICDFVSDLRAPTPSAAAELVFPDVRELYLQLDGALDSAQRAVLSYIERRRERLLSLAERPVLSSADGVILPLEEELLRQKEALLRAISHTLEKKAQELILLSEKASSMSPLSVLSRGYAVPMTERGVVTSVSDISPGEELSVVLSDGKILATVTKTLKNEEI